VRSQPLLPPRLTPSGAESEFNALAKAYELLWRVARSPRARALTRRSDAEARAAWDGWAAARSARLERDRSLDERRKKMKHGASRARAQRCAEAPADLEAREREHSSRRSDEEVAKDRLKAEARPPSSGRRADPARRLSVCAARRRRARRSARAALPRRLRPALRS